MAEAPGRGGVPSTPQHSRGRHGDDDEVDLARHVDQARVGGDASDVGGGRMDDDDSPVKPPDTIESRTALPIPVP